MKKTILSIAIATSLAITGVALLTSCGGETTSSEHNHSHSEVSTSYQCPMKCEAEKTYDKPGKCPVCKMNLKEVEHSH